MFLHAPESLKFSRRGPCDAPAASTGQLEGTRVPFHEPLDLHLVVEVHGCSAKGDLGDPLL